MDVNVDSSVLSLIKDKAHPNTIDDTAQQHHPDLDTNILLCYAVYYRHKQYVKKRPANVSSPFCPMITALYKRDHAVMDILMKKMEHPRNYALDRFYGKIEKGRIVCDEEVSIWGAVCQVDDIFAQKNEKLPLYDFMFGRVCSVRSRATPLLYEEVLRTRTQDAPPHWDGSFITPHQHKRIRQIVTGNAQEFATYCQEAYDAASKPLDVKGKSFDDCVASLDTHSRTIMDYWLYDLQNGSCTREENLKKLKMLTTVGYSVILNDPSELERCPTRYVRSLYLLNAMTTVFVRHAPDLEETLDMSVSWLEHLPADPSPQLLPVYQLFVKQVMILVRAFYRRIMCSFNDSLVKVVMGNQYARGVARVLLSMLNHDDYERFRLEEDRFEVSGPRSLKELCRLKLHEIIPALGSNPQLLDHLGLGRDLTNFLTLYTSNWYSMDWGI